MEKIKGFVKKHLKKFIIGAGLAVLTLGGSVLFAIIKNRGEESE